MTYSTGSAPRSGSASAPDAIIYGWRKVMAQPGPWIGFTALAGLLLLIVSGVGTQLATGTLGSPLAVLGMGAGFEPSRMLSTLVATFLEVFVLALLCRAALDATTSTRIEFREFFELSSPAPVAVLALAGGVAHVVLSILWLPGVLIGGVLWLFVTLVLLVMIDRDLGFRPSLSTAWTVLKRNTVVLIVLWILVVLLNLVGTFLCGVGLLVTLPVTVIAQAAVLRRLAGRSVL